MSERVYHQSNTTITEGPLTIISTDRVMFSYRCKAPRNIYARVTAKIRARVRVRIRVRVMVRVRVRVEHLHPCSAAGTVG